ncbi:membrane transport protein [mine drainage metagenome]|uniref:Membrane transport protein n=1 Tax=mine drainage metagenome TaxID=410659 RepID=A0A1J5PSF0_9ZZZZ
MLHDVLLLFPDFALIALGFALRRWTPLQGDVWSGVERLVYYVLFPALLFSTSSRAPYTLGGAAALLLAGVGALLVGIALGLAPLLVGADRRAAASGAQCAFRFNSYIALAVADRVGGAPAVSLVAVLIAFGVPLCNAAAVWPLARHAERGVFGELARNPLLLATAAGLAAHALNAPPPRLLWPVLDRLGGASIALGLLTVGAGLQLRGLHRQWRLSAWLLAARHLGVPLTAWMLARALRLDPLHTTVVVMFTAVPTASSAYVLAARMGGDAPYVAGLVSLSTLLGAVSLPLFLLLAG